MINYKIGILCGLFGILAKTNHFFNKVGEKNRHPPLTEEVQNGTGETRRDPRLLKRVQNDKEEEA